ncbi:flagellar biosynthesis protein FlhA [Ferroacidibacillus organovorans]|uniref:Flagellar biosynthesis protein FlhA n=1 Tax=Ferroacidibacillus organovorans TaxID=1765683 RepID=A0A162UXI7_9BACL|nr:flagellar biosynthesis protein FlhA [Ferroacidibacillus organovorans]KYP82119.1 EscV/YscV/HrcV family type III secretion system export apparatus protein [Ferroacidibacillus organovorans]OAG94454.1 EscV/YscV/HrcV family type III secretion system export apparatus protein [Ferroacidibacillus organovorans]OPG15662.1 flagellar biosynthesis protein FlhA [Ferroacidibacillus organovorans]
MSRFVWLPLLGIIGIIAMLVIPIPPTLLDVLLIINLSISLTVLLVAMSIREALDFSVFPSLLLVTTLFRLALNVSSTRLILTQGYAGHVIETFGSFVIGSNAVVGVIVFIILIIIQFIVITRGAERVAEVAARFTLDAMPGKQISIDADLNSGLINETDARQRRKAIEQEADFYGAMDGASKFVKGDAIASMIIVAVNIIGGFIIGMAQLNLSFSQAITQFTQLSVGDGLVSQIPALLLSTATGLIVTRSATSEHLGKDILQQIFSNSTMLSIVAGLIVLLGIFTPISILPTLPVAIIFLFASRRLVRRKKEADARALQEAEQKKTATTKSPESMYGLLHIEPIEFEFGYALVPMADRSQGGDLLERVGLIRKQCALDLGIVVPMIRFRDNLQLKPNEYIIKIRGTEVARFELVPNHYLAMSGPVSDPMIMGIPTKEPAFGLPAEWVNDTMRERAVLSGYTVVDPPSLIATHLTEILKTHADELLGRQEVRTLLDAVKERHPVLLEELVPQLLAVGDVQRVLCNLLRERVSIRDLVSILEALADQARFTRDPDALSEYVRQRLARQITDQVRSGAPSITAITLSQATERRIQEHLTQNEQGSQLALDPRFTAQLIKNLGEHINRLAALGKNSILLVSPAIRAQLRKVIQRTLPDLSVLSYAELDPDAPIESGGVVNL